jgi:hypothetical protein
VSIGNQRIYRERERGENDGREGKMIFFSLFFFFFKQKKERKA